MMMGSIPPAKLVEQLRQHVDRLAGLIGPRHLGIPGRVAAAATLIERELTGMGYEVARQSYRVEGHEVSNLVATLAGTSRADEILVVGAHYDTERDTPGADDNASAVAVLLEVARLLRSATPQRSVRFIAFPCEEPPHFLTGEMGSQVYARHCRARDERIIGMLSLEMLGFYSSAPGSQKLPPTIPGCMSWMFPKTADFLAAVGNLRSWKLLWRFRRGFKKAVPFPLFSICLPELVHEIRLSDNSSFWDQGYPALMVTDTSFLRNPHYHRPSDTPETLDYDRMGQVTLGVAGGIANLAGAAMPSPGTQP
jgi:Zn-dependent M28 family amino/carboxypeptidase